MAARYNGRPHAKACNLSRIMQRRGMTNWMLAYRVRCSAGSIDRWRNWQGEPNLMMMRRIASALMVGVADVWPGVSEPKDWEYIYQLITERLSRMHYKDPEYKALCDERNWVSVKVYINESRSRQYDKTVMDDYCVGVAGGD